MCHAPPHPRLGLPAHEGPAAGRVPAFQRPVCRSQSSDPDDLPHPPRSGMIAGHRLQQPLSYLVTLAQALRGFCSMAKRLDHVDSRQLVPMADGHPVHRRHCRLRGERRLVVQMVSCSPRQRLGVARRRPCQLDGQLVALERFRCRKPLALGPRQLSCPPDDNYPGRWRRGNLLMVRVSWLSFSGSPFQRLFGKRSASGRRHGPGSGGQATDPARGCPQARPVVRWLVHGGRGFVRWRQ